MSKNFAVSTVAAPAPGVSGVSLTVRSGHGSRFVAGRAVVFPAGATPSPDNAEVLTVSAVAGDTLTIARGAESSSARAIGVGDVVVQGITAGMWDDLVALVAANAAAATAGLATKAAALAVPSTLGAVSTAASGTLAAGELAQVDASGGAKARTLPAAGSVAAGTVVGVKKVDASSNAVTVSRAGGDTITGTAAGQTSRVLSLAGESIWLTSNGSNAWVITTTDTPKPALDGTYAPMAGASVQYPMRRLTYALGLQAAGTQKHIRWLTYGSSIAGYKIAEIGDLLQRAYGGQQAGAVIGAYGSSAGPKGSTAFQITPNSTTGTVTDRTSDFDVWPSGLTTGFTTTGTRVYGMGGGAASCDNIEIYYITGPASSTDGGTFSYQVDSGSIVNVDTSAASAGIARVSLTPTVGNHTLTLRWVSGNSRVVGVAFWNSTVTGFLPMNVSQGGINLHASQAQAFANFQTWLGWVNPDVITFEMKANQISAAPSSADLTAFTSWANAVKNASTNNGGPDVVVIGAPPDSQAQPELTVQDAIDALCKSSYQPGLNIFRWDGYRPLGSYANVLALGWQGDGIHLDWKSQEFLAGLLARDLGLFALPIAPDPKDTNAATVSVSNALVVGPPSSPRARFRDDGTDARIVVTNRALVFRDSTDASTVMQIIGAGGLDNILPRYSRMGGTGFPYVMGFDASAVGIGNNGSMTNPRDIYVRGVVAGQVAASVSGAVTADLTNGTVQLLTLTGNVTSFAFSNPGLDGQEIEVHFIQDGTGSRTLAGAAAAIKWAGAAAPTLTTTAGRRDIFRFRKLASTTYYEVSRSLNVG